MEYILCFLTKSGQQLFIFTLNELRNLGHIYGYQMVCFFLRVY